MLGVVACSTEPGDRRTAAAQPEFSLSAIRAERWEADHLAVEIVASTATMSRDRTQIGLRSLHARWSNPGSGHVEAESSRAVIDLRDQKTILLGGVDLTTSASVAVHAERADHDWVSDRMQLSGPAQVRFVDR